MTDLIISFILGAIITAIAYLIFPAIFCIISYGIKRTYSLKTIKIIVIINGLLVFLIFQVIQINAGKSGISGAVILWSWVAYCIMKKFLSEERIEREEINKKERGYKVALIVVSLLLVLSLGLNLYQLGTKANTESAPIQSNNISEQNREKLEFFDEFIVIVEDDNTDLYHKYECYRFRGENFWVYNIDQADSLGYKPCPTCCG